MTEHIVPNDELRKGHKTEATAKLPEAPTEFAYIPRERLHVDHSYQRLIVDATVRKILRAGFTWADCGFLDVNVRPSGLEVVINGQHRLRAYDLSRQQLILRGDDRPIPCILFHYDTVIEEANAFRRKNDNQKPLTLFDDFHAALRAEDKFSLAVMRIIKGAGLTLVVSRQGNNWNQFASLRAVQDAYAVHPLRIENLLKFLATLGAVDNQPILSFVITAFMYAEAYVEKHSNGEKSILTREWENRIITSRYGGGLRAITKVCGGVTASSNRDPRVAGPALLEFLNKMARGGNKLPTPFDIGR